MEEQKKPDGNSHGKHHGHKRRRHGYFLEPKDAAGATVETTAQAKPVADNAPSAKPADNASAEATGGKKKRNRHHRGKKHKADAHQGAAQEAPIETAENNRQQNDTKSQQPQPQKNAAQQSKRGGLFGKPKSVPFTPPAKATAPAHSDDEYEEYKLYVDDENAGAEGGTTEDIERTEVVGVRFKSTGKIYYFDPDGKKYAKGTYAIVDTARGQEFGEVASTNSFVRSSDIIPPLRKVIRSATPDDVEHNKANKKKEEDAFKICSEKIAAHGLDMKLIEAQYTFDNTKLLFYFTSSDRVDFRNLVKDLASVFRTRIELRQIGIRDEAKLMGGLGMCGRPLCCTLFLSDFDQVSIKMAKEQNLSLNSAKISGICGRLMCCLRYEHEAYEYEIKRTPPVGSLVRTENGDGYVTEINPLRKTVKVSLIASPEVPAKVYNRDDVTMLRKKKQGADNK